MCVRKQTAQWAWLKSKHKEQWLISALYFMCAEVLPAGFLSTGYRQCTLVSGSGEIWDHSDKRTFFIEVQQFYCESETAEEIRSLISYLLYLISFTVFLLLAPL